MTPAPERTVEAVSSGPTAEFLRPKWLPAAIVAGGALFAAGFLAAAWRSEALRSAVAWLAPKLVLAPYAVVWTALLVLGGRRLYRARGDRWRVGTGSQAWLHLPRGVPAALALVAAVLLSLLQLVSIWERGLGIPGILGGIIPFSDAHLYMGGAERLLYFDHLDVFSSQRPWTAMLGAVWLGITGSDVRLAVAVQTVLVGVASFVAARAVYRDLGPLASLAFFAALYSFASFWGPRFMTEPPGVILGLLAFAALWSAIRARSPLMAVGGMFLLALALAVRAGPLPVALALCVWFAHYLRASGRLNWRVLGALLGAVLVATASSYVVVAALKGDVGNVNGNSAYLAYGMARGHPGWERQPTFQSWELVLREHPELLQLPYKERNGAIRDLAREEIVAHPVRFSWAGVRSVGNYVARAEDSVFAVVPVALRGVAWAAAVLLAVGFLLRRWQRSGRRAVLDLALFGGTILSVPALYEEWAGAGGAPSWFGAGIALVGFVAFLVVGTDRWKGRPELSFALTALAGLVASIPFIGTDTVRVFASVLAFFALFSALAVAVLVEAMRDDVDRLLPAPTQVAVSWSPLVLGGALVVVALVGTPLAMASVGQPHAPTVLCPDGRPAEPLFGGVALQLVAGGRSDEDGIDRLPLDDFRRQWPLLRLLPPLEEALTQDTTVVAGITAGDGDRLALLRGRVRVDGDEPLQLCGQAVHDPLSDAIYLLFPHRFDFFVGTVAPGR